jgi:glycosyltransferase involved in cell wall biosynthesis
MKRIGIDARFYSPTATGVGRHVAEVIDYLSKHNSNAEYLVFLRANSFEESREIFAKYQNITAIKAEFPHYSFLEQTKFLQLIKQQNVDLIVFPQFNFPVLYSGKFIVTIHDLTLHLFPGKKKTDFISRLAYKYIIKKAAEKAEHVLVVSENTKQDVIKLLKITADKISVVGNGVSATFKPITDAQILAKFRQKYQLPAKYFLYTGVMRSHKNILGLVDAFAKFREKNTEVELVLAGPKDKMYFPEILKKAQDLGIEQQVHFTGFFPEKDFNLLFAASSAFVFPTFYEGFGIPPLEAMAAGIPVITSHAASMPEVCDDAALYFDPYNQDEMTKIMHKVLNAKIAQNLINKGFNQYKKFTWDKVGKCYLNVIKQII